MLTEQLPTCIFGHKDWGSGGASLGPGYTQEWFTCKSCGLTALFLSENGGNVFLILEELDETRLPKHISTWINDVLRISWRANALKIKEARDVIEARYWDEACVVVRVPLKTTYPQISEDKRQEFSEISGGYQNDPLWRQPEGINLSPLPPQLPTGVACFILTGREGDTFIWKSVGHDETTSLAVPDDPIKVKHDAYFGEVFQVLRHELGIDFKPEEIPNQYSPGWKPQPWFKFQIGENTFIVGPRKRVDSILVKAPTGIATEEIRKVALDQDNTTYSPNGNWHGDDSLAQTLEVHAWTKEKLIQYLTILGKASLPVLVR